MKTKLVVLGSGFGAFSCLKRLNHSYYDISVVSPRNHFLFTPLLPSTTVGTIEFRSIIEPIRNVKGVSFFQAKCIEIDPAKKSVLCQDTETGKRFELSYDKLLIAVGELTNTYGIEGVKENALFLREVTDARKIRIKVIECFENASLPGITDDEKRNLLSFVVCGGGPTGVEFAAELHDFIVEDVKKKYPGLDSDVNLLLIEAGTKLLNSFDKKLSAYTMKIFRRQHIKVMTGSYITKVTSKTIFMNDGSQFDYGLLVWAAGNIATPLITSLNKSNTKHSKLLVDDFLQVINSNDVYSLGDCSEHQSGAFPVTAQVAQQQGKYLAKQLNRIAAGKQPKPFRFRDLGMLAYIGSHKALANTKQYKGSGFTTWLFWRSVYFTKLVSTKNKVLVLFDWFKTFMFGRDVSNF